MDTDFEKYKENFSKDFSVQFKTSYLDGKTTYHIHDVFEIMLIRTEGITTMVENHKYEIRPNTLLIFNHMDLHFNRLSVPNKTYDRYVIYFSPEFVTGLSTPHTDLLECFYFRPFDVPWILPLTSQEATACSVLLDKIIASENQTEVYGSKLYSRLLLGEFLLKVNRSYREHHHISISEDLGDYRAIYEIINFIHHNYADDINLDLLAKKFYINKFRLCDHFKKVTGMTPIQYLAHCRIIKAKELLLQDNSVELVCSLTGYNSMPNFSRSFTKHTGTSPKKFQLAHKNQ